MKFKNFIQNNNSFGIITKITPPLIFIKNLPEPKVNDLIILESNTLAQIFQIREDYILAGILDTTIPSVEEKVIKTNQTINIKFTPAHFGTIIDPLGRDFFTRKFYPESIRLKLDTPPLKINKRALISKQLLTGILAIDVLIPIGKGQREAIIGGKKTGKTSLLKSIANANKKNSDIIIYAAIGKKLQEIEEIHNFFLKNELKHKVITIATTPADSPALISLTPFAAFAIAEFFRDQGINTIVMLDDLTNHAKFYREISLIAKNPPGRESYPGNIFYVHAKLLEKAGNFVINQKEISITSFPTVETTEDDLSGFIQTNILSITDGHIFLDPQFHNKGRRPAINPFLSVTRVGKQIQPKILREIRTQLFPLLSEYEHVKSLQHLMNEISEKTQKLLEFGSAMENLFKQYPNTTYSLPEEIMLTSLALLIFKKNLPLKYEDLQKYLKNPILLKLKEYLNKIKSLEEIFELFKKFNLVQK